MNVTYQDYEASTNQLDFLVQCVADYKGSAEYRHVCEAYAYFEGRNTHIMGTKPVSLELAGGQHITVDVARIPSNIFKRLVLQLANFQLSEGVAINEQPIEALLGAKSNRALLTLAKHALVGGVAYGVVNNKTIQDTFTAREMFVLRDEWDSTIKIAVRFWSVQNTNGTQDFMQVFLPGGFSVYTITNGAASIYREKENVPYMQVKRIDGVSVEDIGGEGVTELPIVPMYANENQCSELTPNIKAKIDNLDEIVSKNASFVVDTSKIFWALNTTFGGNAQVISETMRTLQSLGLVVMGDDEKAQPTTVDPASASRLQTKEDLESDIYRDFMALDMDALTQSALTATAINASSAMLKLRASDLYWYVRDFIEAACALSGITVDSVTMKQAVLTNELERVQMISLSRGDLTTAKALELNPMIEPEEVDQLLTDLASEQMTGLDEPVSDDGDSAGLTQAEEGEVVAEAEQAAGKTLNGAQTQSLIAIVGQFAAGTLTEGQAVNIISVSIGVTKNEATALLRGV